MNESPARGVTEKTSTSYLYRSFSLSRIGQLPPSLRPLLFPKPRSQAGGDSAKAPLYAISAWRNEAPAALILAESLSSREAHLLCWKVAEPHLGQGLGSALLHGIEQLLRDRGYQCLCLSYRDDWRAYPAISHIVVKAGWSDPEKQLYLYKCGGHFERPAWFDQIRLPQGYEMFDWSSRSTEDEKSIVRRQAQSWHPAELTPFQNVALDADATSLGLRYQGEVIGWLITHRVAAEVLQYTSLFISPEPKYRGCMLPVIAKTISRQVALQIPRAIFQIRTGNTQAIRFVESHFAHLIQRKVTRWSTDKDISR